MLEQRACYMALSASLALLRLDEQMHEDDWLSDFQDTDAPSADTQMMVSEESGQLCKAGGVAAGAPERGSESPNMGPVTP